MKIILATDSPPNYGLAYFYYLALKKNKAVNKIFYLHSPNSKVSQTISNRILKRLNNLIFNNSSYLLKNILTSINEANEANEADENVNIILFNSSGLNKSQLDKIYELKNVFIYNYMSDHPAGMSKKKFQLSINSLRFLKKTFVFSNSLLPIIYQYGAKDVEFIPFGFCKENHYIDFKTEDYLHNDEICYFGTWGPLIEDWLYSLKDFNLKIYGNYWNKSKYKILRDSASCKNGMQDEMSKIASKAAVVINFTRAQHGCLSSMKTFELAASGSCIVTNRNICQLEFFDETAFSYFDNKKEMVENINKLLVDKELNILYRLNAQKALNNFSYDSRAEELFSKLVN